jgi:hypothetical protein
VRSRAPLACGGEGRDQKAGSPGKVRLRRTGKTSGGWSPATPPARQARDEIRAPATLVEAILTRSRTWVRFPPSPLICKGAKKCELRPFTRDSGAFEVRNGANKTRRFAGRFAEFGRATYAGVRTLRTLGWSLLRVRAGLTQEQLAERLGAHPTFVWPGGAWSAWGAVEHGDAVPAGARCGSAAARRCVRSNSPSQRGLSAMCAEHLIAVAERDDLLRGDPESGL